MTKQVLPPHYALSSRRVLYPSQAFFMVLWQPELADSANAWLEGWGRAHTVLT
jgi:hypothetical protein